jgi:hypothetical protein
VSLGRNDGNGLEILMAKVVRGVCDISHSWQDVGRTFQGLPNGQSETFSDMAVHQRWENLSARGKKFFNIQKLIITSHFTQFRG